MRKNIAIALGVAALFGLALTLGVMPALAKMTLKYGHVGPPFHGQTKGADAFAKYVAEKTGGEIEIKTFPMGQLGPERSLAEQVQAGTLEMATVSTSVLSNFAPEVAVMDLPFAFPDRKTAYAVIDDPEWQKAIFSKLAPKGFVAVGWTENEFRDVNSRKGPVKLPSDLKGVKIRVMNSPVAMDTFREFGASPVGIPFPELYNALQQGVIDAQENPLFTSILIKALEVAKYVTKTEHQVTECVTMVTPAVWEQLTPEQQEIFRQAGALQIKVNREVNKAAQEKLPKYGISMEEYCQKNGVRLTYLTPEERGAFRQAVQPVWQKYRPLVGPELYDLFMAKIKEHSGH